MDPTTPVTKANAQPSFIPFIFREKMNRRFAGIAVAAMVLQLVVFKLLYPYADFFSDSYSYIYAAATNLDVNIWPIGYSKFLMIFHWFTHSDTAVVAFQYFFLELSALYFFFTILYFYHPGKTNTLILFIFLFFNPLSLYISNYINSDPLFAALSLLWFTELIWIIHRPGLYHVFTQAILLFLAFTVRHNAMYYPFIGVIAFALSRQPLWRKLAGALLGAVLIVPFVIHERNAAGRLYGTKQFSPMSGWLLANNALYMYGHIQVDSAKLPNAATRDLDRLAKDYYKQAPPAFDAYLTAYVANYFIRQPDAPLKQYFWLNYNPEGDHDNLVAWGKASVVFDHYGSYLIKHYPLAYARHFMLRNTKNYFIPPLEKLEVYNLGLDEVWPPAPDWFHYKSSKVTAVSKDAQAIVLFFFPNLFMVINIYFIGSTIYFFSAKRFRSVSLVFTRMLLLFSCFWLANFFFSIFSSIIVLRYQFFPMMVCLAFSLLVTAFLYKGAREQRKESDLVFPFTT